MEKNKGQSKYQMCLHVIHQVSLQGLNLHHKEHILQWDLWFLCYVVHSAGRQYHTYSHVKYKALSTFYKAETLCCFTCGLFEYVPSSKCIVRRDQTGWFIQVSNCALPLNTTSSIISVILRAIWEKSWLSFSSILDGCRKIHTLKSAWRQCGTL